MPNLVWSECGKVERTLTEWGQSRRFGKPPCNYHWI